jgi:hypothetical protein
MGKSVQVPFQQRAELICAKTVYVIDGDGGEWITTLSIFAPDPKPKRQHGRLSLHCASTPNTRRAEIFGFRPLLLSSHLRASTVPFEEFSFFPADSANSQAYLTWKFFCIYVPVKHSPVEAR